MPLIIFFAFPLGVGGHPIFVYNNLFGQAKISVHKKTSRL